MENKMRAAMIVAGSDSIAGAGVQRDIKTFHEIGTLATTVITCITAQNTSGIRAMADVSLDLIQKQIDAITDEHDIVILKTGMLHTKGVIDIVHEFILKNPNVKLVLDPVMVATSGAKLLNEDALSALTDLVSKSYIVTPNSEEAEVLAKMKINEQDDVEDACRMIYSLGAKNVIIKGGHLNTENDYVTNTLFDGKCFHKFTHPRIKRQEFHGSGCMFASALSAYVFKNHNDLQRSVKMASDFTYEHIKVECAPRIAL